MIVVKYGDIGENVRQLLATDK